jgi:hypothetical protein
MASTPQLSEQEARFILAHAKMQNGNLIEKVVFPSEGAKIGGNAMMAQDWIMSMAAFQTGRLLPRALFSDEYIKKISYTRPEPKQTHGSRNASTWTFTLDQEALERVANMSYATAQKRVARNSQSGRTR